MKESSYIRKLEQGAIKFYSYISPIIAFVLISIVVLGNRDSVSVTNLMILLALLILAIFPLYLPESLVVLLSSLVSIFLVKDRITPQTVVQIAISLGIVINLHALDYIFLDRKAMTKIRSLYFRKKGGKDSAENSKGKESAKPTGNTRIGRK